MSSILSKDDILQIAAEHFGCYRSQLRMSACFKGICKLRSGDEGESVKVLPETTNVVYFILQAFDCQNDVSSGNLLLKLIDFKFTVPKVMPVSNLLADEVEYIRAPKRDFIGYLTYYKIELIGMEPQ